MSYQREPIVSRFHLSSQKAGNLFVLGAVIFAPATGSWFRCPKDGTPFPVVRKMGIMVILSSLPSGESRHFVSVTAA